MVDLDACIYTIIAILSVAYPILLQVISRLDDKYSSVRAVRLFEQEPVRKWFEYFLIGSVGAVVLWFARHLVPASMVHALDGLRTLVLVLVFGTTCGLLVFFFKLTRKTLTYYNTQRLADYLQVSYRANRTRNEYFEVLADVFVAAVAARNSSLAPDIAHFFSQQFAMERCRKGKEIIYPAAYYELAYRSTEELAMLGNRKPVGLTHLAAGGGWLLGDHQHQLISERTYAALWFNLRTSLDYHQEDMVYEYWRTAHQYFEYGLPHVRREYESEDFSYRVTNEPAIHLREQERARYLEFHQVLGALVLYTGRPELLRRLFDHTTSQPPRYPLLPEHMTEIYALFVSYYQADRFPPLDASYSFPNEAGLAAESLITGWIFTYLAVLFLRQYTLGAYLVWDEPLAQPVLPKEPPALKSWLNASSLIRRYVTQVLGDATLLRSLRLDFITEAWCQEHQVDYPLDFLAAVEQALQLAYRQGADAVEISPEKVAKFYADSEQLLTQVATAIMRISAPDGARMFAEARYLRGRQQLISKDAFADNPEISHPAFSSALATGVVLELENNVARLFARNQSVVYRVPPADVFAALDKLALSSDHVIINLGLNLDYLASQANTAEWQPANYRGAEILSFQAGSLPNSLFIMKRGELPAICFLQPDPADVAKYGLRQISQQFNLYAAVLDASNLSEELATEVQNGDFADEQLKAQALEILWLSLEFKWQQSAKLIWLQAPYQLADNVNDLAAMVAF